jgi:hypothetical protein
VSVAILIPVLGRPHRIAPLIANIDAVTLEPHHTLFAASDEPTIHELELVGAEYLKDDGDTYPHRINALYGLTDDPYIFTCADDVVFHAGWLAPALEMARAIDGVVMVNDLHNPAGTMALISRSYIEAYGGTENPGEIFHPGYRHNWCDTELIWLARRRRRCAFCHASVVEHLHPAAGKAPMDETYAKGMSSFREDMALFNARMRRLR